MCAKVPDYFCVHNFKHKLIRAFCLLSKISDILYEAICLALSFRLLQMYTGYCNMYLLFYLRETVVE